MFEIAGKYGTAKVFVEKEELLEESARTQIQALMDNPYVEGSQIRIMPDCHAGKGCVIGFTQTLVNDCVIPSLVGSDIGCGILVLKIKNFEFDKRNLGKLDNLFKHGIIPSGFNIYKTHHAFATNELKEQLESIHATIDVSKAMHSIGSIGGGNHFVSLEKSENTNDVYLIIHTGSRHLGLEIEKFYSDIAKSKCKDENADFASINGEDFAHYIHDMKIAQMFASLNRQAVAQTISDSFKWTMLEISDVFETIHNYIDNKIVRKGAIRLLENETAIISMNMSDGSLIVKGKGNPDWNFSGPHGAGRLMSRAVAKQKLSMKDFKSSMEGIYTTSVCQDTIDESKMAYKPMESIIEEIGETCEIIERVKPIYNFKASEKTRR